MANRCMAPAPTALSGGNANLRRASQRKTSNHTNVMARRSGRLDPITRLNGRPRAALELRSPGGPPGVFGFFAFAESPAERPQQTLAKNVAVARCAPGPGSPAGWGRWSATSAWGLSWAASLFLRGRSPCRSSCPGGPPASPKTTVARLANGAGAWRGGPFPPLRPRQPCRRPLAPPPCNPQITPQFAPATSPDNDISAKLAIKR